MMVPSVTGVVRLDRVLDGLGRVDEVELARSMLGKPALRVLSGGILYFYALDGEPRLIAHLDAANPVLRLNDFTVRSENSELSLSTGGRTFRGDGLIRMVGTHTYITVCRRNRCLAGIFDIVDGVAKLYEVRLPGPISGELRRLDVSTGLSGFSIHDRSSTLAVSVNGVELIPGFFRFIASCPAGDYLVDREGFLVRVRNGILDVVGRMGEIFSAACLSDGIVVADTGGLKTVRYGAYTTVSREAAKEISSFRDVISVVSRTGVVRILCDKNSYTLDSPLLKSCVTTAAGVACLTDDSVIFLDPATPVEVELGVKDGSTTREPVELMVRPWFDGCRLSIAPKFIAVWDQGVDGGTLRAKIYPRILGWEGRVRVVVECPTYRRVAEEYVRFGKLELERVVEKSVVIAKSGRLLDSADHNCVGKTSLRLLSGFPLPIPVGARVVGVDEARVTLDSRAVAPGSNEISVEFTGICSEERGITVKLETASEFLEPEEVATVYIDPREFRAIGWGHHDKVEILEAGLRSVIKAPGSSLRLYCLNGSVLEGRDFLTVENCEEPALLELAKIVDVGGRLYELRSSRVLRESVRMCHSGACGDVAASGGFYSECGKFEVRLDERLSARIEHEDGYRLSVYLGGAKAFERKFEPIYLVTGLSVRLGASRVWIGWRDVVRLALWTAVMVGRHMGDATLGTRGL